MRSTGLNTYQKTPHHWMVFLSYQSRMASMSDERTKRLNDTLSKLFGKPTDLHQKLLEMAFERFQHSWSEQDREEKKNRMTFIMEMVRERDRILDKHGHGALMFCEAAIENVIMGDVKDLGMWREMMTFSMEPEPYRSQMAANFEQFRNLCQAAEDTICPTNKKAQA